MPSVSMSTESDPGVQPMAHEESNLSVQPKTRNEGHFCPEGDQDRCPEKGSDDLGSHFPRSTTTEFWHLGHVTQSLRSFVTRVCQACETAVPTPTPSPSTHARHVGTQKVLADVHSYHHYSNYYGFFFPYVKPTLTQRRVQCPRKGYGPFCKGFRFVSVRRCSS